MPEFTYDEFVNDAFRSISTFYVTNVHHSIVLRPTIKVYLVVYNRRHYVTLILAKLVVEHVYTDGEYVLG